MPLYLHFIFCFPIGLFMSLLLWNIYFFISFLLVVHIWVVKCLVRMFLSLKGFFIIFLGWSVCAYLCFMIMFLINRLLVNGGCSTATLQKVCYFSILMMFWKSLWDMWISLYHLHYYYKKKVFKYLHARPVTGGPKITTTPFEQRPGPTKVPFLV